jgi:hypothetical protein
LHREIRWKYGTSRPRRRRVADDEGPSADAIVDVVVIVLLYCGTVVCGTDGKKKEEGVER